MIKKNFGNVLIVNLYQAIILTQIERLIWMKLKCSEYQIPISSNYSIY